MSSYQVGRYICLNRMEAHDVFDRIMQRQVDKIYLHDPRKTMGQIVKEPIEISLRGNRLRDFQKSLITLREGFAGMYGLPIHEHSMAYERMAAQEGGERPYLSQNECTSSSMTDFSTRLSYNVSSPGIIYQEQPFPIRLEP